MPYFSDSYIPEWEKKSRKTSKVRWNEYPLWFKLLLVIAGIMLLADLILITYLIVRTCTS